MRHGDVSLSLKRPPSMSSPAAIHFGSIYVLSINTYYEGIACSYQVRWARVNSGPTPARENEKECALASVLHLKV